MNASACSPGEVPYRVQTPHGPAEITLVTAAIGIRLTDAGPIGDRLVLRSASDGLPDAYAVFERVGGATSRWMKVTGNLSLAALDDWRALRRPNGITVTRSFQQWLDNVANGQHGSQDGTPADAVP